MSRRASSIGLKIRSGRARAGRWRRSWASNDYLEQYFATNVIFEPLVGELFRSGFIMQMAAAQNDFITPAVVSAAEGDYERNLANTVELFSILVQDPAHGEQNRKLFTNWATTHGALAVDGGEQSSADLVAAACEGRAICRCVWSRRRTACGAIAAEIGFDARGIIAG